MKYFLIAGEVSGDIHAASLIKQIKQRDSEAQCIGLGGDQMATAGCYLYQHISNMAFMGIAAVVRNIRRVIQNFKITHKALLDEKPDVLILVDYPSFNLKIASFCREHLPGTKIYYYIPPKVWAWKQWRIHKIARLCDKILGIFPFEPEFYTRYGYKCTYVGNPTAEILNRLPEPTQRKQTIAILPGSRPSEVNHCLPRMLDAARRFTGYTIIVCAAPTMNDTFYRSYLHRGELLTRDTYGTVREAAAAIVNSGTATLETALLGCPQVAVYYLACSRLIGALRWMQPLIFSIPYFTLVNIIAGKKVIKECVANEFTVNNIANELARLLTDESYKKEMLVSYKHLSSILGSLPASITAAQIITSKP
ncbi:MAG: lipid-A-disaccharide synthase [Paludibacteraceae bacterium]